VQDSATIEKIWLMRVDGLRRRRPSWILQSFWVPPLLLPILMMQSRFSRDVGIASLVSGVAFIVYSMGAYVYWSARSKRGTTMNGKGTILVVLGYDGLTLAFFSVIFLAACLRSLHDLPYPTDGVVLAILAVSLATILTVAFRGRSMLEYIADHFNRPIPPGMRWLLGIPPAIIGAGVALAAILQGISLSWLLVTAITAVGTFLLMPFAVLTLYQIPMFLLWRSQPRPSSIDGQRGTISA